MIQGLLAKYGAQALLALAIAGGLAWGVKVYLNKRDARVYKQAEIATKESERKRLEPIWAEKEKAYAAREAELAEKEKAAKTARQAAGQLKQDALLYRQQADATYAATADLIKHEKERTREIVDSIPLPDLDRAILNQSNRLPKPR